jgi:hypothetical protein
MPTTKYEILKVSPSLPRSTTLSLPAGPRPFWLPNETDWPDDEVETEPDWAARASPLPYVPILPSSRLGVLQTSSSTKKEALRSLFLKSTSLFLINGPDSAWALDSINFEAAKPMQNFLIHLSLLVLAGYPIRPSEAQLPAEASNRLISNIATAGHNMTSCVIRICHYGPSWACPEQAEFLLGEIAAAVIKLTRSKTVVLRLLHENGLPSTDTVGLPRLQAVSVRERGRTESEYAAFPVYGRLDEMLSSVLGPSETVTNDGGYYTLTYHPQSHLDKVNSHTALGDRGIGTAEGSEESGVSN